MSRATWLATTCRTICRRVASSFRIRSLCCCIRTPSTRRSWDTISQSNSRPLGKRMWRIRFWTTRRTYWTRWCRPPRTRTRSTHRSMPISRRCSAARHRLRRRRTPWTKVLPWVARRTSPNPSLIPRRPVWVEARITLLAPLSWSYPLSCCF